MISKEIIEAAAERLRTAEASKKTCAPVRDLIGIEDLAAAYAVQKINTSHRIASGGRVIGHKIGLTAPVIQKQLGVDQPDFGLLWQDREIMNGGEFSVSEMMQPKAEAEIAFVLGKDLTADFMTTIDVLNAVEYALASIEVVGSRISNWDIKITDTIADNASASHWVVGHQPVKLSHLDLVNCKMRMENNGKVVSEGVGNACMGSPINALLWLARKMVQIGEPLKAGDLILSGAIGPVVNVVAGADFKVVIEGLGSVNASFVA
ncbi:2-keto-4-pentenoate hydratase [Neolewinella persica]|uniref:2-keto-4-pentenoate hydratase n=1 Tax=Neolewinella persica TaxID=70998 RepID=UPI00037BDD8F|nr:fumarylacetoacetate hydrolase family protein [Neolewinella persica]